MIKEQIVLRMIAQIEALERSPSINPHKRVKNNDNSNDYKKHLPPSRKNRSTERNNFSTKTTNRGTEGKEETIRKKTAPDRQASQSSSHLGISRR